MPRGRKPGTKSADTPKVKREAMLFPPQGNLDKETVIYWNATEVIVSTNLPTLLTKLKKVKAPDEVMSDNFSVFKFPLKDFNFQPVPKKKKTKGKKNATA